jgi:predicted nuclease of restriction endonuclease-like (RecB) superfamily
MQTDQHYTQLLQDLKSRISQSRYIAARLVNREQLLLYYYIGKLLNDKITEHSWGDKVLSQIAVDLKEQIPSLRGFSASNLKKMRQFYTAYEHTSIGSLLTIQLQMSDKQEDIIGSLLTIQLQNSEAEENWPIVTTESDNPILSNFLSITFTHHITLLNKCKALEERMFYIKRAAEAYWSISVLEHHIQENLFTQIGKLHHNFDTTIEARDCNVAAELFKDKYLLDFLQLKDDDNESEIENSIVSNITEFILKMGKGFSFIGNQFRLDVDGHEFSIDLLFYNRILRRLVAFEIKKDRFKPEYTGQLHFYLNVLDDKIKLPDELPSIGIILCKEKHDSIVQYSIRNMNTPMGVATFMNSSEPPAEIQQVLPDSDQLRKLI